MSKKYHLIVNADKRTWKNDRPVIFLGEWCFLEDRQTTQATIDAITAEPYGVNQKQKDADFTLANRLNKEIFPILIEQLNKYHNLKEDERYWRIILGHWFARFLTLMINRIKTLEQCFERHQIAGVTLYGGNRYSVATNDSYSWIWASHNDRWNGEVYSRILEKKRVNGLVVEKIIDHETEFQYRSNIKNVKNKSILKELLKKVNALASYLSKKQKYFIKDSYLSRWHEFLLSMSFYQIPVVWRSRDYSINNNVDYDIRNAICSEFENNFDDECLKIIGGMLFEMMPVCYLEGFEELLNITERQSWPTSPKLIFTSNSFDTDEVFKLWTAQAVKDGSKYVVGQHGNNYGTHRYMNPSVEEQTADKFLTWGWSDGLSSHKPAFVFKNQKKYKKLYNSKGGLLLIEVCGPHRINTADESYEFNNYLRDQQNFVGLLDKRLLSELTVRLHAGYVYTKWRDDVLWSNFNSTIKIDKGTSQIRELISKSRLIVHGYDSTGMLESLERNIPTIAFWSGGLDHLRDSAIPFYNHLINAGIVHLSSESAAQHVNKIWNDVDGWWKSKPVQVAKEMFCAKYAQSSKAPVRHLKQILEECCE